MASGRIRIPIRNGSDGAHRSSVPLGAGYPRWFEPSTWFVPAAGTGLPDRPISAEGYSRLVNVPGQSAAMVGVDRFVDRAIGANSAIRAIGGTTPWYLCT